MKKTISFLLSALILALSAFALISCTPLKNNSNSPENTLHYGEKYIRDGNEKIYFIFNEDGTGEYHTTSTTDSVVSSGIVYFDWRSASDGAIYLFENKTVPKEDNTKEDLDLNLTEYPIYVSEDFITYSYVYHKYITSFGGGGSSYVRLDYIREGSSLDKN